jgi:hypothetical protein
LDSASSLSEKELLSLDESLPLLSLEKPMEGSSAIFVSNMMLLIILVVCWLVLLVVYVIDCCVVGVVEGSKSRQLCWWLCCWMESRQLGLSDRIIGPLLLLFSVLDPSRIRG